MKQCVITEMAAIKLAFILNHWYSCEIRQFKSYLRLPSKGGYQHKTPKLVAFSKIFFSQLYKGLPVIYKYSDHLALLLDLMFLAFTYHGLSISELVAST